MKTIIAEKPSVAREIARIVGAGKREEGYLTGNGYNVTWAFGHLVQPAMPEEYNLHGFVRSNLCDKECPIAKHTRIRSVDAARTSEYTFQYSDIDFNQHVNSLRYIRLLLDQWTADFHNEQKFREGGYQR
jgi:DNA topoisomerase IA